MTQKLEDLAQKYNWPLAKRLLGGSALNSLQAASPKITDVETCRAALLLQNQRQQLDFIKRDIALTHKADEAYLELTKDWSNFADDSLDLALRWAWQAPRFKKTARNLPPHGDPVPGLFILGLGKLGGHDLNFSSDVDLVAFYDKDSTHVAPYEGKTDVCANVLRTMGSKIIDGLSTTGQFVWRVDWRLRPDPSVTDLVISTEAAEDFYFFRSASWRRLAMMKARVVAGDKLAGEQFMKQLHPFIWRRHLDYRAIDEIAHLKQRIKAEHPSLSSERMLDNPLDEADSFNLKLGRGGIREIEFFVNAQQLLWGGRIPALQTTNTLQALSALAQEGLVDTAITTRLREAYIFFRRLENKMQYWNDAHTHFLPQPEQDDQKQWLAEISHFGSWDILAKKLNDLRRFTAHQFDSLLAPDETRPSAKETKPDSFHVPLNTLTPVNRLIAEDWLEGFGNYSVGDNQKAALTGLGLSLVTLALKNNDPGQAISKIHKFIGSMVVPGQYLRLLAENETLMRDVIHPLLKSSVMENLLMRAPHLVDGLLRYKGHAQPNIEVGRQMIAACTTTEKKLEAMRGWCNEQKYQIYLTLFRADCTIKEAESHLTTLAEMTLTLAAKQVCDDLGLEALPFAILAMGKLGMGRMTPGSDLDLIFICPDGSDLDMANKASRRFQNILSAQMREGRLYEIDMRLRPSGSSGPPTVSLRSFKSYHLENAKTWEHLALVPARIVYGSDDLTKAIEDLRHSVLTQPRDLQQSIDDSWKMLSRIRAQRISKTIDPDIDVKLWPGGGMETEYLLCFLALKFAPEKLEIAASAFDDIPTILGAVDPGMKPLGLALRFWRDLQFRRRLVHIEKELLDNEGTPLRNDITKHQNFVLQSLELSLEKQTTLTSDTLNDYREQPILWCKKSPNKA